MDYHDAVAILFRVIHILSAATAIGATLFAKVALLPAAAELADPDRQRLMEGIRSRWAKVVHTVIALLLVSGLYSLMNLMKQYKLPVEYHILFTVKLVLALGIFAVISMLMGRSARAAEMRKRAGYWFTVNLVLMVILVTISARLRSIERIPKANPPAEAAESAG